MKFDRGAGLNDAQSLESDRCHFAKTSANTYTFTWLGCLLCLQRDAKEFRFKVKLT